jgi:DNA polymerase III delta subunit
VLNLKPNQAFLTGKYRTQAGFFEEEELKQIVNALINLDASYKSGLIDLNIGLDAILCRYCS